MKPTFLAALLPVALATTACTSLSGSPAAPAERARAAIIQPVQRVTSLSTAELDALATRGRIAALAGPARCAVDAYRIVYRTVGGAGEPVTSSAAVLLPRGDDAACAGPRPTLMYARGTAFVRDTDLSHLQATVPDAVAAATLFAAQGYAVVAPNYVGYAASNASYHPYYQLEAQAQDVIDALLAARAAAASMQMQTSAKLFLVGYSQGGAVALATQRALERPGAPAALHVTAAAASAGATMIGNMANEVFKGPPSVAASGFLPLLLTSYQRSYGGIYTHPGEVYAAPFDAPGAAQSIPGEATYQQLIAQGKLPPNLFDRGDGKPYLIQSAFRQAFNANARHPMRLAFEANNLDGFKPVAPLMLCHGSKDLLVTVANTDTVARAYTGQGSTVTRVDLEDPARPLSRAFNAALDAAAASTPRAVAYHFVGMPFCNTLAREFFAGQ